MQRDLTQFVENIKNKNFDSLNERQVETSIVIPLLESLGWDTTIEDEVKVQSGIGKGKSDIELRTEGLCKVIIDAKKGKANLANCLT